MKTQTYAQNGTPPPKGKKKTENFLKKKYQTQSVTIYEKKSS